MEQEASDDKAGLTASYYSSRLPGGRHAGDEKPTISTDLAIQAQMAREYSS